MSESQTTEVYIQPTPNPNALKFVLGQPVKNEGKATYRNPMECDENNLAKALFTIRGVDALHFFDNVITVSKFSYEDWDAIEEKVKDVIQDKIETHNPDFVAFDPEARRRETLSPELLKIEEVLDKTIRPALQADGGDLRCLEYKDNVLIVKYEGACGNCPSSEAGTLHAIRSVLQAEIDENIEVYIAPT